MIDWFIDKKKIGIIAGAIVLVIVLILVFRKKKTVSGCHGYGRKYKKFSDPYYTTAKFDSYCSSCKKEIKKGKPIVYDKMRSLVYCDAENCGESVMRSVRAEKSMDQYGTDIY